ncbi:tetratricopeptide repeat protein [Frankia sp. AgW1.1]|uniref:tetratricopeptide repeat protein n=1 Tax=Frankia sp. AgB1.9 TaxID=1836968 RepID=UPI001A5A38DB|nr:tetratricopeptide repeat protein [Frankia sp. AgW1.1]MBL7622364.1 tetratricopeptide repeat protein [Frankia sp. AgB1.8]
MSYFISDHPAIWRAIASLALTLRASGDGTGAQMLEAQVVEICRKHLGRAHPYTEDPRLAFAWVLRGEEDTDVRLSFASMRSSQM